VFGVDRSFIEVDYVMQSENSFDKLSKRVAVAVSRRSLLRTFSLAVAGAFLPWSRAARADDGPVTPMDVETKLLAAPVLIELTVAEQSLRICIVSVRIKNSDELATLRTVTTKDGECPNDVASYFNESDRDTLTSKNALFDETKTFEVRVVGGRSRLFNTFPTAVYCSFINPITGKQEFEAFCQSYTYLDPRVHKGDSDRKIILYKRMPTPEKLTSLDDDVTCGDINYAYENEIKTRKPIALRDFTVDAVPHQASAKRLNSKDTFISNRSGHKSK
jgi:hypothetical protein